MATQLQLPNQDSGYARLLLLTSHTVTRTGMEGSGNFGWPAAIYLLEHDLNVVDVPPLMTPRERLSRPAKARPNQLMRSRSPHHRPRAILAPFGRLPERPPSPGLTKYRDQLVDERTALANRIHTHLGWLRPGYQRQLPHLTNMAHLRAALELLSGDDSVRTKVTRSRLAQMLILTEQLAELRIQIAAQVRASGRKLPEIHGVGPIVGHHHWPRLRRAPLPHSAPLRDSQRDHAYPGLLGRIARLRLNRGGNRQLSRALYTTRSPRSAAIPRVAPPTGASHRRQTQQRSPPLPQKTPLGPDSIERCAATSPCN